VGSRAGDPEAVLSSAAANARSANIQISPVAILLCAVAGVFAVIAGYGLLGQSPDYPNYLAVYDQLLPHELLSDYRYERGYMLASWFCKFYLGMDFAQYYTLLVAVALLLKFRLLLRYASAPLVAAATYLLIVYPYSEYTQLRAAVAFAFAFTAMDEFLGGKWFTAIVLFAVAQLFHSLAIVLAGGAVAVLLVRNRSPVFITVFFCLIALGASMAVSAMVRVLQRINPLVWKYVNKTFLSEPPNLFSGENILFFLLILSSAVFLRPWQNRRDAFFYYLSFWTLIAYAALLRIPVFAHRIAEAFIFSFFFFTFRFDDYHRSRIPAFLMMVTAGWMLYEEVAKGVLLVYVK
jgi:hypothetical protein